MKALDIVDIMLVCAVILLISVTGILFLSVPAGLMLSDPESEYSCTSTESETHTVLESTAPKLDRAAFLQALYEIEGGSEASIDTDQDPEIGPFQITVDYWIDCNQGRYYYDMMNHYTAAACVISYMERYAGDALASGDVLKLARIHNGGPNGHTNPSTHAYGTGVENLYKLYTGELSNE